MREKLNYFPKTKSFHWNQYNSQLYFHACNINVERSSQFTSSDEIFLLNPQIWEKKSPQVFHKRKQILFSEFMIIAYRHEEQQSGIKKLLQTAMEFKQADNFFLFSQSRATTSNENLSCYSELKINIL